MGGVISFLAVVGVVSVLALFATGAVMLGGVYMALKLDDQGR